ncbi:MAG: DUF1440 domain-containing protein [Candidatus Dormibacteraeota bacterium]|nr:DUF1440 domain-containing protein [Candidatus Dormibacteraeota bacterium]
MGSSSPLRAILRGAFAGAVGVAVMDAVLYGRYRRGGGDSPPIEWGFGGDSNWEAVSAPAQVGRRLYEGFRQRELPARRARLTNNVMHWGYGIGWATAYGILAGTFDRPRLIWGPAFGASVWLSSYVLMPLAGLYKPIWEYDALTLWKDLTPHLAYGTTVAGVFRVLTSGRR